MAVTDRLMRWAERVQELPLKHLPPDEHVIINERQHPAVLIMKAVRTGSGLGMWVSAEITNASPNARPRCRRTGSAS